MQDSGPSWHVCVCVLRIYCHHGTCLSGTRESVLDEIMQWAEDPQESPVFWLNGLAGTGKSTIAQMVANNGDLGAGFFCSWDYLDHKELKNIFPTLAYQLHAVTQHFELNGRRRERPTLSR